MTTIKLNRHNMKRASHICNEWSKDFQRVGFLEDAGKWLAMSQLFKAREVTLGDDALELFNSVIEEIDTKIKNMKSLTQFIGSTKEIKAEAIELRRIFKLAQQQLIN